MVVDRKPLRSVYGFHDAIGRAVGDADQPEGFAASAPGPTMKSFEAVGEAGREALESDLLYLIARFDRTDDGTKVVPSEYLEAVFVKRSSLRPPTLEKVCAVSELWGCPGCRR
jgi:hypothetical protein